MSKEVIIIQRSSGPAHDQEMYTKVHAFMREEAMAIRAEGIFSDEEIIASHTRVLQQMAANATEIAQLMGIALDAE